MRKSVTAKQLKTALRDGKEMALIDVREEGVFSAAHTLFACCIPLSRIELDVERLVPRKDTRIVLIDEGDDGLVEPAAEKLMQLGYSDVAVMQGGMKAWSDAGLEVFSGVNVPSKAFGEFVEQTYHTPHIAASDLKVRMDRGDNLVILDSRPIEEFRRMHIPTGIDAPGAELVYRVHDAAPDPNTLVVVNCAGRTRSIIGAQSLINAGIPNKVMALENGTMGWHLAGEELAAGEEHRRAPLPSADGLAKAKQSAARVAKRFGVKFTDGATLAKWQAERDRTLFLLDVRAPEEYAQGHLPECGNAPGGQLVQATDEYVGVRNARIVLVDDTQVRAIMTASWLVQMGWTDVHVLKGGIAGMALTTALPAHVQSKMPQPEIPSAEMISPRQLQTLLADPSVAVIDLGTSVKFRDKHIPGAWWAVRSRLKAALAKVSAQTPMPKQLVLVSPDGVLAQLAAGDLKASHPKLPVRVLQGGSRAWFATNLPSESGIERATTTTNDVWYKPYENRDAMEQSMRDYITWEIALVPKIARDGDANFKAFS
ncbi:MAG: rhodanese-like domain-containing protein [Rhodospirillales bacterium]